MPQSLFSSLTNQGSLPDAPIGVGSGDDDGLFHGRGGDMCSTKQSNSKLLMKNNRRGITISVIGNVEEGEVGKVAGRTEEGRG